MNDNNIYLKIGDNSSIDRFEYVSKIILKALDIKLPFVTQKSKKEDSGLFFPGGIKVKAGELESIFRNLSLVNEISTGFLDSHQRFDERYIDWEYKRPWISELILKLNKEIVQKRSDVNLCRPNLTVILTHDIDWITGLEPASFIKTVLFSLRLGNNRWLPFSKVRKLGGLLEVLNKMLSLEKNYGIKSLFFLHSPPYGVGRFSTRYNIDSKLGREFIEKIHNFGANIGLHSSYSASENDSFAEERQKLSKIIGSSVCFHRSHYLRFNPIDFWSKLEKAGITYDFSMGFVSKIGFRNGLATAYHPYDLLNNKISSTIEVPVIYMDRSNHLCNQQFILGELEKTTSAASQVGGCISINFHYENIAINLEWLNFYDRIINICLNAGADFSVKSLLTSN